MTIEGLSRRALLELDVAEWEELVLHGRPVLFRAGTAEILGQFRRDADLLVLEFAVIEGGGEGVLLSLWNLVGELAARHGLSGVDWVVHAVHCANPNLRLRRVLERRGFRIREIPGVGPAYTCHQPATGSPTTSP
ncbi:MAG: hypothetical protein FJX77_07800 [Armatimonadetes bacterium]|nr:hypothetical protein [Armatimonadota bacterium]